MSRAQKTDEPYMRRALALAQKGEGSTSPNPLVGAVLVKRGKVIGEGYHVAAGLPHAEINALADAKKRGMDPTGATMVVTLEPCCHTGRTPPCTEAIIAANIRRVVIGVVDENPCVAGCGVLTLRSAGIDVTTGVLEKRCRSINAPFFHKMLTGKPLVVIKAACSLDGKIATRTGHSQWISGPAARRYAHRLRARYDAICVGLGTVLADDPQLTYRGSRKAAHPLRVILDSRARIPLDKNVVSGNLPGKTRIAVTDKAPKTRVRALAALPGVEVATISSRAGRIDPASLVEHLGGLGLNSLLVEGGGTVLASFIDAGVVDLVRLVLAPMFIGGTEAKPVIGGKGVPTLDLAPRLERITTGRLGEDLLIRGWFKKNRLACEI